ncbi:glycosyltransferase family 4 protein [Dictyobacter arantiisoli]|uniref:Glycosyl transferase family 1 domain-containing protein n=1 Tax=Dictyobacter arantiisoli TaxID=2014874 RepID=A0A5A5T694_9CHLR|nr:glycosyltransferase family 4 protein [Dictyobacter arantiisoli]GCF06888.1 hypothetical protein KDI_04520 [Dictyobacter arantiisoli]
MDYQMKRPNIALLTALDAQDRRSWSGTFYFIAQTLQKYCGDVSYLGPMSGGSEMLLGRALHTSAQLVTGKRFLFRHSRAVAKRYARIAQKRLTDKSFDVVIALSGATEIAYLQTALPVVLVEDANFPLLHGYHQHFSSLLTSSAQQVNEIQARGLARADLVLYSTSWAAQSAVNYYHVNPQKIQVVPFGANIERIPDREKVLTRKRSAYCSLLFVGVNWERKGGQIAFDALCELGRMGIDATLTVCGCMPPRNVRHPRMLVIPFLDKNDQEQCQRLEALYLRSDFLLLPTRNECFGIAACEASAFGLPVVTTHTGGVPEVVRNGENGFTLPYDASGQDYALLIARVYQNPVRYQQLIQTSRDAFEQRLNWDLWGMTTRSALERMLYRVRSPRVLAHHFSG